MKVLVAHSAYQVKGGEDVVVDVESRLLAERGCEVDLFIKSNDSIVSAVDKIKAAASVCWSRSAYREVIRKIERNRPDVVHVHNFFPLFSPSIFDACRVKGVPSVLTLHNYRILCPTALLMWDGEICERSINGSSYWAVPKRVYRNSWLGTLALVHMIEHHKKYGTWREKVDRFICLTEFAKSKFVEGGVPAEKISVKPNFIPDPGWDGHGGNKNYGVFIGRLSREKGLDIAMNAWRWLDFPLRVFGEGEAPEDVPKSVRFMGRKNKDELLPELKHALFMVIPSIWYEGFPMVILEAFACGVPVVCSRLGSLQEIVEDGYTGLHFEPGNSQDLAQKIQWLADHPAEARAMGDNARRVYLEKYTPQRNYQMLMEIYLSVVN